MELNEIEKLSKKERIEYLEDVCLQESNRIDRLEVEIEQLRLLFYHHIDFKQYVCIKEFKHKGLIVLFGTTNVFHSKGFCTIECITPKNQRSKMLVGQSFFEQHPEYFKLKII